MRRPLLLLQPRAASAQLTAQLQLTLPLLLLLHPLLLPPFVLLLPLLLLPHLLFSPLLLLPTPPLQLPRLPPAEAAPLSSTCSCSSSSAQAPAGAAAVAAVVLPWRRK